MIVTCPWCGARVVGDDANDIPRPVDYCSHDPLPSLARVIEDAEKLRMSFNVLDPTIYAPVLGDLLAAVQHLRAENEEFAGKALPDHQLQIARNILDKKYLNPMCAECGCQALTVKYAAEADLTALRSAVRAVEQKWKTYQRQEPRSFNGEQADPKAIERENTLISVFLSDLDRLAASVQEQP